MAVNEGIATIVCPVSGKLAKGNTQHFIWELEQATKSGKVRSFGQSGRIAEKSPVLRLMPDSASIKAARK